MYENKARLLCTAESHPRELFEKIVTVSEAKNMAMDDPDLCVDNELGFAKDRTISRYVVSYHICSFRPFLFVERIVTVFFFTAECQSTKCCRLTEMNSKEYLEHHAAVLAEKRLSPESGS